MTKTGKDLRWEEFVEQRSF